MPKTKKKSRPKKKKPSRNPRPMLMLIPVGRTFRTANPIPIDRWFKVRAIRIGKDGKLTVRR